MDAATWLADRAFGKSGAEGGILATPCYSMSANTFP